VLPTEKNVKIPRFFGNKNYQFESNETIANLIALIFWGVALIFR
jgi:hypothetical protein